MKKTFYFLVILPLICLICCESIKGQALNVPANFPKYQIITNNSPSEGYYFISPVQMPDKNPGYLAVIDNYGTPVYYRYFSKVLNSFGVQRNNLLSFMGRATTGAMFYIMDSTYTIIDSVKSKTYKPDPHDFIALKNGHFLFIANDPRIMDMSSYGGKTNASVVGCVVQELDQNKNVVFEWKTWDHFKISDSYADLTVSSVDLIHHNSIDVDEDGNYYLISRSLNEVTKINGITGDIIWRLGGKNNQFKFTDTTSVFSMPHDFRKLPNGNFTLFDNGNERNPPYTRAVEYSIDQVKKVVTLVWSFDADKKVFSGNSGSVQRLPSGNTVVGYGYDKSQPALIEVNPDKSIAFRLDLPDKVTSYRAVKFPWKTTLFVPNTYSIDFGQWDGYTTSSYLLPVFNKSNKVVTLTSYSTRTNAFSIEESFPINIPAHGQITLTVDYFPGNINTGVIKDVLTLNSDINTTALVQRIAQQIKLSGTKTDVSAPVATIPLANKSNVSRDTVIYINFSESIRKTDNTEFNYENIDQLIIFKKNNASGENVPFDAIINIDKKIVTVTPKASLDHTQTYYVAITNGYEDYSNNSGAAASATFKTIDLTSPVVTVTPLNNATNIVLTTPILIQFDEPVRNLDNSELTNSNVGSLITFKTNNENGNDVTFTATVNAAKTIISIETGRLTKQTAYYVAIKAGVEDYSNNPSSAASSTFTTGLLTGVDYNFRNPIKVYPNPGNGLFNIESSIPVFRSIKVTNLRGEEVLQKHNVSGESYQLDLRSFQDGMYFLYIDADDSDAINAFKLIKQDGGK
jgi:hypothetical protein